MEKLSFSKTNIKTKAPFGQALVEIIVAMGLMVILMPALTTSFVASREGKPQEINRLQATTLLKEAEEALRSVREAAWSTVATAGTYHPEISGTAWSLVSGSELIDTKFTRSIVIADVQRDSGGAIVTSGGTVDDSTKQITTTVSWTLPIASSVSSTNYITRFLSNAAWEQTTDTHFNAGTATSTTVTNNSGGEVELSASSGSSWATPTLIDSYDNSGNSNGNAIWIDGDYAYVVTDDASNALLIIDVSDPTAVSLSGSFNAGVDVNDVYVSGDYAYLATDDDSQELMIVDVSNKSSPSLSGSENLATKENAFSVYVSGNYAYVGKDRGGGSDREFYVVDVSTPSSPSEVGNLEINADVNGIHVSGDYAYLANDSGNELLVIDISTPSSPSQVGSYDASSGANGENVFISGSTAYLVTENNGSGNEFYIIDISTPTSPSLTGSFNAGGSVRDVYVSGTLAFLSTDVNNKEYTAVDISTPASPTEHGTFDLGGAGNGIFIVGDYAFIAGENNSQELSVLEGGAGSGGAYVTSGTFESQSFDATAEAAFNYLTFSVTEPAGTDINLQYAVNNDDSTWSYIGPDGTNGTYYESADDISLGAILGRYFRFKAYFTGDGTDTPVFSDFSVNYSP